MKIFFKKIIIKIINFIYWITNMIPHNYKKSEIYQYAKHELDLLLELLKEDEFSYIMQKRMNKHILKCIAEFCKYGHNKISRDFTLTCLNRLMAFLPLTQLSGLPNEWEEVGRIQEDNYIIIRYQNKRYFYLFKYTEVDINTGEIIKVHYIEIGKNDSGYIDIAFPYFPVVVSENIE